MSIYTKRQELIKTDVDVIKKDVILRSWASLKQYFDGNGNGSEAKVAVITLGIIAKEQQAENNRRAVDLAYSKFMNNPKNLKEIE